MIFSSLIFFCFSIPMSSTTPPVIFSCRFHAVMGIPIQKLQNKLCRYMGIMKYATYRMPIFLTFSEVGKTISSSEFLYKAILAMRIKCGKKILSSVEIPKKVMKFKEINLWSKVCLRSNSHDDQRIKKVSCNPLQYPSFSASWWK